MARLNKGVKEQHSWLNIYKDMSAHGLELSFKANREYVLAKDQYTATSRDNFLALALSIRDRIVERWIETQQYYHKNNLKRVYYFSMEFLIGRLLGTYLYSLGVDKESKAALETLGYKLEELREQEVDAGLGNGGLGRLAACFLDSMATLEIPAHGYGIRYDYGIFQQKIQNGHQVEIPDEWLRNGCPWEFPRPEYTVKVKFYGRVENQKDDKGVARPRWVDTQDVLAVPYDTPVVGHKNDIVNTLRLWSARSTEEFDFDYFNHGDYEQAVYQKIFSENISKVLYPNDKQSFGKELRLKQEYFFTAASIADIIRRYFSENKDLRKLDERAAIQLNDTHPALAVAELMRILVDEYNIDWDAAFEATKKTIAYTNHTLMPEALECWSIELLQRVLPRHLQIIYEINARFLNNVQRQYMNDQGRIERMSLVAEDGEKRIRMANLCIVGSHSVNGVSRLHSDLLKEKLFKDFYEMDPKKFNNKTNGITPRRWLLKANPRLSDLITESIGDDWVVNLDELKKLEKFKEKKTFRDQWAEVKLANKKDLAEYILKNNGVKVDPYSMFDVQVKRMHEYKRQLLFTFYIISEYLKIKHNPKAFVQPRTFMLGGKAAPGYFMAKLIIKFINNVACVINNDKSVSDKIKLIFLENYRVSLAEKIFPASDLSEQISTAGTEASGTGNMKFMINGALTIGTLDGANVEMAEELSKDDIFIFGLKTPEVDDLKRRGYNPQDFVNQSQTLKEIQKLFTDNFFSQYELGLFDPILQSIFYNDNYLLCADFESYIKMQDNVSKQYQDKDAWIAKSISNVARSGKFSSDRTISEYAKEIWGVPTR
ncbi:MAG: glycogen/starch/alpha-glucan phosphorylase [Candidatus Omnitrophica bacterium]|nr:glycogen/starch/alpha-glucan phosphorylase [Candidatus Omnitrophota bacterium]